MSKEKRCFKTLHWKLVATAIIAETPQYKNKEITIVNGGAYELKNKPPSETYGDWNDDGLLDLIQGNLLILVVCGKESSIKLYLNSDSDTLTFTRIPESMIEDNQVYKNEKSYCNL